MEIAKEWLVIFGIVKKELGRDPTPDEMQDAWEDYLGQSCGT